MKELTLAVVGVPYKNQDGSNRRFEVELCRPGDPVELRPEPKNKHDSRAIGVWRAGGGQLGYITAERAAWIGKRLQEEEAEAVYQGFEGSAAYIRIRFGGGSPTLPPATGSPRHTWSEDFYADPAGPDWGA